MPLKIGPRFFSHQSKDKESPPDSARTNRKASAVASQSLEKGNTRWHTEENLPLTQNANAPVPGRLSLDRVDIISAALKPPQIKEKPTPLPRSDNTRLSPTPEHSKIDNQKKAFGPDLSAVVSAKNALKPSGEKIPPKPLPRSPKTHLSSTLEYSHTEKTPAKNTPPLPPPQKNKPKFESVSATVPTSPLERRVSFQTEVSKDPETNSPKILETLPPLKGILKRVLSFSETTDTKAATKDSKISASETVPFNNTDIESKKAPTDEWADVDRIFSDCFEYLNVHSSSKTSSK